MDINAWRRWATPLTIGAFLLMSVTGVLMFFHLPVGLTHVVHEWLSWLMVSAVVLHITLNWKVFSRYFQQKLSVAIMGALAAVLVAALLVPGNGRSDNLPMQAARLLVEAPLNHVATLTGKTLEGLQAQLTSQGLQVDAQSTSLKAIADANKRHPMEILEKILK